jgi:EAL domain-containing protein (putative c-di-GMP-specific phosphodiesterase class I)
MQIKNWSHLQSFQHVAVNVSPVQFRSKDFVSLVKEVLKKTGANPDLLMLELTEGILVQNVDDVIEKMQALRQVGVHFSVDDFGTGYSSLAYLKRFPLDQLKIDRSFVQDVGVDDNDQVIIETIIAMAERMGFNLIAEGVETIEQLQFLKEKGCYNYQGWYFGHPVDVATFEEKFV